MNWVVPPGQSPRRRSTVELIGRAAGRVLLRIASVPIGLALSFDVPDVTKDRRKQREGFSRAVGTRRCPQFTQLMRRKCADGVPAWMRLSQRQDAVLGDGNCSHGPIVVVDSYRRWRWQVTVVGVPEFGESFTLQRWVRRPRRERPRRCCARRRSASSVA